MKNYPKYLRWLTIVVAVLVCLFLVYSAGYVHGSYRQSETEKVSAVFNKVTPSSTTTNQVDFEPFWMAWNLVDQNYMDGISSSTDKAYNQQRVWGAISGMVNSLGDPYSVFLPPVEKVKFEEDISGNFSGVGMEMGIRDETLTVIAPLPNTPAQRAGILPGDKVVEIDGVTSANMAIDQAVSKIRGLKGSTVTLTIVREGKDEPFVVKLVRDTINVPTIETKRLDNGVFLISLYNFYATSPDLFRDSLRQLVESGSDKLILDLRGNPGGYLESAVSMASWFLPKDKIVVVEKRRDGGKDKVYRSAGYDVFNDNLKMVILVDQGSASASEILAGALSEYGIATLVGEKTFGKGSVQQLIPVTADSSLKLTVARWFTPKGLSISHNGLQPDVEIKAGPDDIRGKKDAQLDKAVEILLAEKTKKRKI